MQLMYDNLTYEFQLYIVMFCILKLLIFNHWSSVNEISQDNKLIFLIIIKYFNNQNCFLNSYL